MKKNNNYTSAIVTSVILHAVLVAALLWGTDFSMSKPEPVGNMVQAVVIDPKLVQQQAREIRQKREAAERAEQERIDKLRKQSELLEKNRQAEEARIRKLKEEKAKAEKAAREAEKKRKLKEQERKREEEKVRKERERAKKAEADRKAKQAATAKAEKERLEREKAAKAAAEKARIEKEAAAKAERERIAKEKAAKEAAEKARKEKERLQQLERERKEQEAAMENIFAGLETEASANSSAKQRYVTDEVSRYGAIYTQLIQSRLLKDDSFLGKPCRINMKLVHTGSEAIVSNVQVLSGDKRVCSATKSAIAQVGGFPVPKDQDVARKLKDINLTVELQ